MIKKANTEDLFEIVNIYNQAVKKGFQTADTQPVEYQNFKREFLKRDLKKFPFYVYIENNEILGWVSISPYRYLRPALDKVAEVSFYVDHSYLSQGIGSQLLGYAIDKCKKLNFEMVVAILVGANNKSISLLKKYGFDEWGRIPDAYSLKGKKSDHLYYGRKL